MPSPFSTVPEMVDPGFRITWIGGDAAFRDTGWFVASAVPIITDEM